MYYSDHSYQENDDDQLYEAFVDKEAEFVEFQENIETGEEVEHVYDQRDLSDGDSMYDSNFDCDGSFYEENQRKRKTPFKNFRPKTDMEDPQFRIGMYFSNTKDFKAAIKQHALNTKCKTC